MSRNKHAVLLGAVLFGAAAAAAFGSPRLFAAGDVALGIPIGDMAGDDLDTGYRTVPVFRGALAFVPFSPFGIEFGTAFGLRSNAKTGIDEGEVSWRNTSVFFGAGLFLDMGLLIPHLSTGVSYNYVSRYDAFWDPEDENRRLAKAVSARASGFYIDLGLEYFLYEHFSVGGGLRYDHAFTRGGAGRVFDIHGGARYYFL